LPTGKKAVRCK
jgi:hypothetical protein